MGNLKFGSLSLPVLPRAGARSADHYYLACPVPDGEVREWERISAPGTNGVVSKDHGFRARMHGPFRTLIVASSEGGIATVMFSIRTALEGKSSGWELQYSDGSTFENCYLSDGYPRPMGPRSITEANTWLQELEWFVEQRQ